MKVRYIGPSGTGVEVVHPDPAAPDANTVTVCPPGEAVDLPEEQAVGLMAAAVFEPADKAAEAALRRHQRAVEKAAVGETGPETVVMRHDGEITPAPSSAGTDHEEG